MPIPGAGRARALVLALAVAIDGALTARRVRDYAVAFLVAWVAITAASVAPGRWPLDALGRPVAVDFAARYAAGRMVLQGDLARLYDVGHQAAVERAFLGPTPEPFLDAFLSPPFVAHLYAPLAMLPYGASALVWTGFSVCALVVALRLIWLLAPGLHAHGFGRFALIVLSAAPVCEALGSGQDTALTLLVLAGGLRLLRSGRDVAAGIVLGLGLHKPQLLALVPVVLCLQRRWRAVGGFAATGAVLGAVSMAAVGASGLAAYADLLGSDYYRSVIVGAENRWKLQSLPGLLDWMAPHSPQVAGGVAALLGGAVALVVLGSALATARAPAAHVPMLALAVVASLAIMPHVFVYDSALVVVPAALLLGGATDGGSGGRGVRLALLVLYLLWWSAPLRFLAFGGMGGPLGLLGAPWAACGLLAFLWTALRGQRTGAVPA